MVLSIQVSDVKCCKCEMDRVDIPGRTSGVINQIDVRLRAARVRFPLLLCVRHIDLFGYVSREIRWNVCSMYIVTQRGNPRSDKNAAFDLPGNELPWEMLMTSIYGWSATRSEYAATTRLRSRLKRPGLRSRNRIFNVRFRFDFAKTAS